jgi:hypothetical protein
MKVHLGGQKFQNDGELKCSVLNQLHSQDKPFYAAGISNLLGLWKKCISEKGEYIEKKWGFGDSAISILFVKNKAQVSLEPPM